ncbi:MAG: RNA polymerase sigma factor [Sphingomonadales bacterium]|nr:MAG: RNA polymerase sigma factor [Sphingomonadales bacterium]TNF03415.1 MAG: RNA polymerase sigma factor [Sphingomonadales bacterium]
MSALRPIDRWFIDNILPHEASFVEAARRFERDADAAHDLVQEAYAWLYASDGWASIRNPRHYVLRMLRNMSIERLRRAKIIEFQRISDIEDFDIADEAPCQFRVAAGKDMVARVRHALAVMPERCRAVLVRRKFDGQPPREIARELGISLSTMEKRLARAVVLLSRAIEPERSSERVDADRPDADPGRDDIAVG